jgi:hypothetical protein
MHLMRAIIFGPATRDGPNLFIEVEFRPFHSTDFIAPLRGEKKQFGEWTKRPTNRVARGPKPAQLILRKYAIAGSLFCRWSHADKWGRREGGPFPPPN